MEARKLNTVHALNFILGGKATVTFKNRETGNRYTFKITQPKPNMPHFVKVMTGTDNENSYTFIGTVFTKYNNSFKYSQKSKISETATSVKVFAFIIKQLAANKLDSRIEVWHEGRCCCCGRKLTVPESIEKGIGPDCETRYSLVKGKIPESKYVYNEKEDWAYQEWKQETKEIEAEKILRNPRRHTTDELINAKEILGYAM